MPLGDLDLDTRTQEVLLAASNHDINALKPFLRVPGSASVQDPETGFTPLHAAIAACGPASQKKVEGDFEPLDAILNGTTNGNNHESSLTADDENDVDIEKAKATIKELFLSGAIWNDLDVNDETPGCLAWRLGQKELYKMVVEAGVRAELLMNLLGGYEQIPDEDNETEESQDADTIETTPQDPTPALLLPDPSPPPRKDLASKTYLASDLSFSRDRLLDADANGVMMAWETDIMARTAALLAPSPGLRILNIGFGLGIVDRFFADTRPAMHHIVEAHAGVLARLRGGEGGHTGEGEEEGEGEGEDNFAFFGPGWGLRGGGANVLHEGRWQDVVPGLVEGGFVFDVIYFDTFGEDYSELKTFFTEYVIGLMAPRGRFGFFNGLGADRRVCYDVYCRVVELDLLDAGLDVEWVDVDVDIDAERMNGDNGGAGLGTEGEGEWKGVRRRYWTLDKYRLPVCTFLG